MNKTSAGIFAFLLMGYAFGSQANSNDYVFNSTTPEEVAKYVAAYPEIAAAITGYQAAYGVTLKVTQLQITSENDGDDNGFCNFRYHLSFERGVHHPRSSAEINLGGITGLGKQRGGCYADTIAK